MRRFIRFQMGLAAVLASLGLSGFAATVFWPEASAKAMLSAYVASAGLERKTAEAPFGPVGYLEGGEGPQTVVLLHGLFARKEHWIDLSRHLTDGYRVIILDLPGFGDNPILGAGAYRYARQQANIMAVLDTLGVERFHLAGNSMGGQLAGMVAQALPERVLSVAFIGSPVGITTPQESRFERLMTEQNYSLVVADMAQFDFRNTLIFPKKPFVPGPIEAYWANAEFAQARAHQRVWREVTGSNEYPLEALAPQIAQPALVVWCHEDEVFDFSGAQVLTSALPKGQLVALEGCGHVPSLDAPSAAGRALRAFLDAR